MENVIATSERGWEKHTPGLLHMLSGYWSGARADSQF